MVILNSKDTLTSHTNISPGLVYYSYQNSTMIFFYFDEKIQYGKHHFSVTGNFKTPTKYIKTPTKYINNVALY
jgi:glycogen debranching enzyme